MTGALTLYHSALRRGPTPIIDAYATHQAFQTSSEKPQPPGRGAVRGAWRQYHRTLLGIILSSDMLANTGEAFSRRRRALLCLFLTPI